MLILLLSEGSSSIMGVFGVGGAGLTFCSCACLCLSSCDVLFVVACDSACLEGARGGNKVKAMAAEVESGDVDVGVAAVAKRQIVLKLWSLSVGLPKSFASST